MKSDLLKLHHARSEKDFPDIGLDPDEFVELTITRSKIGIFLIWTLALIAFILLAFAFAILSNEITSHNSLFKTNASSQSYFYIIFIALFIFFFAFGYIGTYVYKGNILIITNKRAIQKITTAPFAKSINYIDLKSVEDVSQHQSGIFYFIFNIGTIRLATIGDETTYTFTFADAPATQAKKIESLVHKSHQHPPKTR
jgi:hypothetical protein